jgi:hypothetical protein
MADETAERLPRAQVTIKKKTVDHNDTDAAGFEKGYWWTLDTGDAFTESGAATKADAEAAALAAAEVYHYLPDQVDVRS